MEFFLYLIRSIHTDTVVFDCQEFCQMKNLLDMVEILIVSIIIFLGLQKFSQTVLLFIEHANISKFPFINKPDGF